MEPKERKSIILKACQQVGPGVFYSTLVIVASFLPVFLLTGQEGKLFHPLAWTKTFILLVDAIIAITLVPVLISIFLKGKLTKESANPINRGLEKIYTPILDFCLRWRKTTLAINLVFLLASVPMLFSLGSEFMPPLDEGSLLFMPVTLPDVSNAEAKRILQIQDKIIAEYPEVKSVLGKAGRASTATDNSPISMVETIIILKPKHEWREGITKSKIVEELNAKLQIPGVVNGWTQPIINRINMLSTGIRTDVGIKVYGQDLDSIYVLSQKIRKVIQDVDGVKDLYVEPITGGKYIEITIKKDQMGKYGLTVDDVNEYIETAVGGKTVTQSIEGRQRFGIGVRYLQDYRNRWDKLQQLDIQTKDFGTIKLEQVADFHLSEGPPMINSENALLRGALLFNVRDRDLGTTVEEAKTKLNAMLGKLPKGYFIEWSGQYEHQIRATQTLQIIMPLVVVIIIVILYITYGSLKESIISLISIPFALMGGVYMVYFYGVNLSVAVAVGFIALFGIAVETGMLMVIYLNAAMVDLVAQKGNSRESISDEDLREAIRKGAAQRLRPKLMTVSVSLFGLIPVLWSQGVGSDVMLPIVLPLIGGVFTSSTHILLVTPVIFEMTKLQELNKTGKIHLYHAHSA